MPNDCLDCAFSACDICAYENGNLGGYESCCCGRIVDPAEVEDSEWDALEEYDDGD